MHFYFVVTSHHVPFRWSRYVQQSFYINMHSVVSWWLAAMNTMIFFFVVFFLI